MTGAVERRPRADRAAASTAVLQSSTRGNGYLMRFSPDLPVFPHLTLSGSNYRRLTFGCVLSLLLCLLPIPAMAVVIQADTTWSGDVSLAEDVLVPEGVTLTIEPGATIRVVQAESTKTDPEFLSPQTEITVRGSLVANGSGKATVIFRAVEGKNPTWAGIIIDGGSVVLRSTVIRDADTGVSVVRGSLALHDSLVTQNRYGITVEGADCVVRIETSQISGNEYGVVLLNGAKIDSRDIVIQKNRKKDTFTASAKDTRQPVREYGAGKSDAGRVYGDEVVLGTVVWQKRIIVQGIVRVPERSRLVILPGTIIEFRRKDTNRDGIGENGILAQGLIIAKGTKEQPIIFRSAEKQRRPGDWDAINIMNSDAAQNLLEYCQVEDAYRGLHFHFSNVAVTDSVIRNNYRGIQFQESVVTIRGTHIYGNKSGLQARDSEILFSNNVVSHNRTGMNVLRNSISVSNSMFLNNSLEGLRVREGLPVVEQNLFDGNRFGLMVSDAQYGTYTANMIAHNLESGLALRSTEGIEISGNAIQANGVNGINVQDSSAVVKNNLISDNGERGIGIQSFHGIITANTIVRNKLYNLGIDGETDVSAPGN